MTAAIRSAPVQMYNTPLISSALAASVVVAIGGLSPLSPGVLTAVGIIAGGGWYAWSWFTKTFNALKAAQDKRANEQDKEVLTRRAAVDLELEKARTELANLRTSIEASKSEQLRIGNEERGQLRERVAVLEAAKATFKDNYDSAMRENRELSTANAGLKEQVRVLTGKVDELQKQIDQMIAAK